jgi:hypothetical protein
MRKKINKIVYKDQPIGKLLEISDFLPPPEQLVAVSEMVKVTLSIDKGSLKFFKNQARRIGSKYQKMMREVLLRYANHYVSQR